MKTHSLVFAYIFVLCCAIATAQSIDPSPIHFTDLKRKEAFYRYQGAHELNKTASSKTRLIARRTQTIAPPYTPYDSSHLYYTGYRFSDDNSETRNYDADIHWRYNNGHWDSIGRTIQTFDQHDNILSTIRETDSSGIWIGDSKVLYSYDNQDHFSVISYYNWSAGGWQKQAKYTFQYDASGLLLSEVLQQDSTGLWENVDSTFYHYNTSQKLVSYLIKDWVGGVWVNAQKDTITYDQNNDVCLNIFSLWSSGSWQLDARDSSFYDSHHQLVSVRYYGWLSGSYTQGGVDTYTYDAAGHNTSRIVQEMSFSGLINIDKRIFTYDNNGGRTLYEWYRGQDTTWIGLAKEEYTCNPFGQYMTGTFTNTWASGAFVPDGYVDYYWYDDVNAVEDMDKVPFELNVYPNPFSSKVSFRFNSTQSGAAILKIFDLYGQVVHTEQIKSEVGENFFTWHSADLSSGVYFYELSIDGSIAK